MMFGCNIVCKLSKTFDLIIFLAANEKNIVDFYNNYYYYYNYYLQCVFYSDRSNFEKAKIIKFRHFD